MTTKLPKALSQVVGDFRLGALSVYILLVYTYTPIYMPTQLAEISHKIRNVNACSITIFAVTLAATRITPFSSIEHAWLSE
jgi:hypothetical protein